MKIKAKISVAMLSVLALSTAIVAPAQASSLDVSARPDAITESTIRADLEQLGVSEAQRDALVDKLDRGIPWESVAGADPVSSEALVKDGFNVTREYFSDGSVSEVGVEIGTPATEAQLKRMISEAPNGATATIAGVSPSQQVSPMATGIQSCTYGSSAGVFYASNCEVYYHGISWSSAFNANYQRYSSGAAAQYLPATAHTVAFTLRVTSESVDSLEGNTRIRYSITLAPGCLGNIPFFLDLKVSSSTASATTGP